MRSVFILLLGLFVVGCTSAQNAVIDRGVKKIQDFNDTEARLIKAETCGVRLGAYFRVYSEVEQRAFDVLCGGEWERPITADDVRALRDLGELLKTSE